MLAGRRTAAATTSPPMTMMRRSSPVTNSSSITSSSNFCAVAMAERSSSASLMPTLTPLPCSPRTGFTTTSPCVCRNAWLASSSPASRLSGMAIPAAPSSRWDTRLSSHRLMATADVMSDSDSLQAIVRAP